MRAILASRNAGKLRELAAILSPLGYELVRQDEFGVPSAPETGSTFVENALIKARAVAAATGLPAFADDSGIVVPALNGAPGIYSARYAGDSASDDDNNAKLVRELRHQQDRRAYYYCAIVYLERALDPTPLIATARWHGAIVLQPRGRHGFGYDPYFLVDGFGVTSAELDPDEKNRISHRAMASKELVAQLLDAGRGHAG